MKHLHVTLISWVSITLMAATLTAADKEENKSEKTKTPPKVTLNGVFEAVKTHEIEFDTEQLASAKVKKIVPHGTTVAKGDFLISLDRESYQKQLKEAERKFATAELTKRESDFANEQFRRTQQLDLEAAEREWKAAQDSFAGYLEFDRQYAIESAKFSLKRARNSLEYQEEDLRQLERMYKEDELTEESEELVLTRARRAVESAKFYLRNTEVRTERTLKESLPRDHESKKAAHERAKMKYEKTKLSLEVARKKKELEITTARVKFQDEKKKLEELQADAEKLLLTSHANGIVFYGALNQGQMSDKQSPLKKDAAVNKDQVIMTIVNPKKLQIRTTVTEKDIAKLSVGMIGTAKPTSAENKSFDVEIKTLDTVPYAKGKYACVLAIQGKTKEILPAMTCSLTFELENADSGNEKPADDHKKDNSDHEKKTKKDAS